MDTCPKCNSSNTSFEGTVFWSFECVECGHKEGGTASFPIDDIEIEHDYDVVFHLKSSDQIILVRSIAKELSLTSTADLIEEYRSKESTLTVNSIPMWKAREYKEFASEQRIESQIIRSI